MTVIAAPDTEAVYVCVMPHVSDAGAFALEEEVRASHPAVAKNPDMFRRRGTPRSEWPNPYQHAIDSTNARKADEAEERRRQLEQAARANQVKLTAARIVTCQTDFVGHYDGRPALIRKGSTAAESDPVVAQAREHWK